MTEPGRPRTAVVTGASSGIGEAFADVFAGEGYNLVLVARREDRLHAVAARLEQEHHIHAEVIVADLAEPGAGTRVFNEVSARGLVIDALVNSAGYGMPGPYTRNTWEKHAAFLNVTIVAATELTRLVVPGMTARRFGRIVNIASLAGFVPAPAGHTLYAASKAFLIKFSEALAHEVVDQGVHVTAVCPGFTRSEFHDVTGTRKMVSRLPGFMWMDAAAVARQGYAAVSAGRSVVLTGRVNATIAFLARMLPQRLVAAFNRRASKAYRDSGSG